MTGEGGDFIVTYPALEALKKPSKATRKALRKAAKAERRQERLLRKAAASAAGEGDVVKADGDLMDHELARFHLEEASRHQRKAKDARNGKGVISLAHGEALARRHEASRNWHENQVRAAGGAVGNPDAATAAGPFPRL